MPSFVIQEKCDGCKGGDKTACMYICPHDLMKLDMDGSDTGHAMKAYNQEPEQCWECYSCVKACPQNAIDGGKKRIHVIDQDKCDNCGSCYDVCPQKFAAVIKISGEPVPEPIPEEHRSIAKKKSA